MIQSVQRAAQVLDVLGSGTPRLGVTEIADRLGLAKPTLHRVPRTLEAVWVPTSSGGRVIVLHHVFRPDNTVQILEVGAAIPWHACALGHAIVAYLPAAEAARAMAGDLEPLTGRTKTTRAALGQALAQVRRRGYAVEDQEATVGDAGIAA